MKRVIAICLMCSLGACASMNGKASNPDRYKLTYQPERKGLDQRYMSSVENQAQQKGVQIIWVNPPRAVKAKKDG